MSSHILKNEELTLSFSDAGAELRAITDTKSGKDYLWSGDPAYWNRTSPILFPIVGSLKNKSYTYNNKTYSLSQHGFARDMEFKVTEKKEDSITFLLEATEETLKVYPFFFQLLIHYTLNARTITVAWEVKNTGKDTMYFSIGAHPAFLCPLSKEDKQSDYYFAFDSKAPITLTKISENGLALKNAPVILPTDDGLLPITPHLFDEDALVIENNQYHAVSFLTPDKKPYVTVAFDAPLFGLWSPAKKNAPFICVEPWYGRCDSEDFTGTLENREWGNTLEAGKIFQTSYTITIG
ncbi:aldose 1-epimerase family protein [Anaerocolumna xylanovorans]|uniref:Galactose mutarotase n=1 Tax=Anaerocolumna xylanovorans DSM 12503 TaxID=1121345 RepID=A0A1M7Y0H7_9FIRM|nr:aldose 1-epimerase family protein [Anaerocolumna xylanovorans]SHO45051.1 Galactose mutarotase [Anaerocolumna xylanovorans DSM 12503]